MRDVRAFQSCILAACLIVSLGSRGRSRCLPRGRDRQDELGEGQGPPARAGPRVGEEGRFRPRRRRTQVSGPRFLPPLSTGGLQDQCGQVRARRGRRHRRCKDGRGSGAHHRPPLPCDRGGRSQEGREAHAEQSLHAVHAGASPVPLPGDLAEPFRVPARDRVPTDPNGPRRVSGGPGNQRTRAASRST